MKTYTIPDRTEKTKLTMQTTVDRAVGFVQDTDGQYYLAKDENPGKKDTYTFHKAKYSLDRNALLLQ